MCPNPEGLIVLLNYSVLYINPKELKKEISNFGKRRSKVLELWSKLYKIPEYNIVSFAKETEDHLEKSIKCKKSGEIYIAPFGQPVPVPYHSRLQHFAVNFARDYGVIYLPIYFSLNIVPHPPSETDYFGRECKLRRTRDGKIIIECEKNGKIIGKRVPEDIYRIKTKEIVESAECVFNIDEFLVKVTEGLYQYSTDKTIPIKCFGRENVVNRTLGEMSRTEKEELCRITPEYYYPLFLTIPHVTDHKKIILLSDELESYEYEKESSKYYLGKVVESSSKFTRKVIDPTVELLEKFGIKGNIIRVDSTDFAKSFYVVVKREFGDSTIVFGAKKGKLNNLEEDTQKEILHELLFTTPCKGECLKRYLEYKIDPHNDDSVARSAFIVAEELINYYLKII